MRLRSEGDAGDPRRRPSGFIPPCLPSKVVRPPSGPLWVHEIKYDGYRLMVRRDGTRVRCFQPATAVTGPPFPGRLTTLGLTGEFIRPSSCVFGGKG